MLVSGKPVRIQRSRFKGFNLQQFSRSVNGLPAVSVTRPGKFSNPYKVGIDGTAEQCVKKFEETMSEMLKQDIRKELAGKNIACWCKIGAVCHGDSILKILNEQK